MFEGEINLSKRVLWLVGCFIFLSLLNTIAFATATVTDSFGTNITGRIIGANNKPPKLAQACLTGLGDGYQNPIQIVNADSKGNFRIHVKTPGVYKLWFSAVDHQMIGFPVVITPADRKITLKARLNYYNFNRKIDIVKIYSDWNTSGARKPEPMMKQPDGTYRYEREITGDTLSYQLLGVADEGHTVNGTMSDTYVPDGTGDYYSVVKVNSGKVTIDFEPRKLPKAVKKDLPWLNFDSQHNRLKQFFMINQFFEDNYQAYRKAWAGYREIHQDITGFEFDQTKLKAYLENILTREKDELVRQVAAVTLARLLKMKVRLDPSTLDRILQIAPPGSVFWGMEPAITADLKRVFEPERGTQILEQFAAESPERRVRAWALITLTSDAKTSKIRGRQRILYQQLVSQYGDLKELKNIFNQLNPDKRIQIGAPAPEFEMKLLGSDMIISKDSFRGKFVLLDFWASGCGGCKDEMPYLHQAYEKYRDHNLEILSIALDAKAADVEQFRNSGWKMPWLHCLAAERFENKMVREFEVNQVPCPVLMGPDGNVVAVDEMLHGEQLEQTVRAIIK
jgi:thiol-disulfide isomerase/thioredoxin